LINRLSCFNFTKSRFYISIWGWNLEVVAHLLHNCLLQSKLASCRIIFMWSWTFKNFLSSLWRYRHRLDPRMLILPSITNPTRLGWFWLIFIASRGWRKKVNKIDNRSWHSSLHLLCINFRLSPSGFPADASAPTSRGSGDPVDNLWVPILWSVVVISLYFSYHRRRYLKLF